MTVYGPWRPNWYWRAYRVWHQIVHVWMGRYRYLCHYCAERDDEALDRVGKP